MEKQGIKYRKCQVWQKSEVIAPPVQHFYSEIQLFRVSVARVAEITALPQYFILFRHTNSHSDRINWIKNLHDTFIIIINDIADVT